MTEALIVVDLQLDFLPGGALGVAEGDRVIPVVNGHLRRSQLAFATLDWHPANHGSFASAHPGKVPGEVVDLHGIPQVLWPDHCVQHTEGAKLTPLLEAQYLTGLIYKGSRPEVDSYSGFFENDRRTATDLDAQLRAHRVTTLLVVGIATDYCVRATVIDALTLGYDVRVDSMGCAGVDLREGDSARALQEMALAGAILL